MLENLKLSPGYDGFLFLAESVRNPPVLRPHHHVELEINLVVQGTITYVADGRRYTFGQRTLLWFFPAQEHQLVDRTPDARYYVAVFKPALIRRSCRGSAYAGLKRQSHPDGVLNTVLEPESYDLMKKTMDALMEGSLDPDILNREAGYGYQSNFVYRHADPDGLNAGLHHLLLLSWRSRESGRVLSRPVALHPCVRRALAHLAAEADPVDLPTLARACGVSPAYLSRLFARQMGQPLSQYRNALRLGRFWEAMARPDRPTVTEAVYAAGFGSYAQFYKVYRQAYGSGPRASVRAGVKETN
ncbi:MAG: helix-turn-helix transcriptional regulator [Opitutales bacterium]|nr:helix-turn-helix transcriptional regulator [Opitutales bacterium]